MTNKIYLVFIFLMCGGMCLGQEKGVRVAVTPMYGDRVLKLGDSAFRAGDVVIEVLKFYITNIKFVMHDKVVYEEQNSFHMVDAASERPFTIFIAAGDLAFDGIRFDLGVDSVINVAGAMRGDLDPTRGMYWTWQSGYINFKLEGESNACPTRNKEFTFHIGGYQQPFCALQTVSLPVKNTSNVTIIFDAKVVLQQIDLARQNHVMSPGEGAVLVSKIVATGFKTAR